MACCDLLPPRDEPLSGYRDKLDAFLEERIDKFTQGNAAGLGARGEKCQDLGIEVNRPRQNRVGTVEATTLGI